MDNALTDVRREDARYPLLERPLYAFVLSVLGGLLNAWTFAQAQVFATAQTGNVVMVGYRLMQKDWDAFWQVTVTIATFGAGVMVAAGFMHLTNKNSRRYAPGLQAMITLVLIAALILIRVGDFQAAHVAWVIAFGGGLQANGFRRVDGVPYSSVGMTQGTMQSVAYLADAIFVRTAANGKTNLAMARLHFLALFGFAGGGALGFVVDHLFEGSSLIAAIIISVALGAASVISWRDPDPTK